MPKREDIKSILVIGAGPIVIGQACEFDYSGTQGCRALQEDGYRVILVNSNPATIMTDPAMANKTYIEPTTPEIIAKIIAAEQPDAILPTLGGQTALNCTLQLDAMGVLSKYQIEILGSGIEAIKNAEDRSLFKDIVHKAGLKTPHSFMAKNLSEIERIVETIGFPVVVRSSFTLGGIGSGIAHNFQELEIILSAAPGVFSSGVQIDQSLIGWKEYEMEVMCDLDQNCMLVCSIENIDPMGVHTGDSITVAPAITLSDKEYQVMRNASFAIMKGIGIKAGGVNVQFAVNPASGEMLVIEANPRVSRSSALASKATGFPIAQIATKLAVGYRLHELHSDCIMVPKSVQDDEKNGNAPDKYAPVPVCIEPALDYVVIKIPRFNFDKFPGIQPLITTSMKSVGEVMAIGRCFNEALQKGMISLEEGLNGINEVAQLFCTTSWPHTDFADLNTDEQKKLRKFVLAELHKPTIYRLRMITDALRFGIDIESIVGITKYDPWFVMQLQNIVVLEKNMINLGMPTQRQELLHIKKQGFSDARIAELVSRKHQHTTATDIAHTRKKLEINAVYKNVDTCAAEFDSFTAYMYSCYEDGQPPECESISAEHKKNIRHWQKVIILGSGPNRIGQGIEFDYACVHGCIAARNKGLQVIMINCNPETVSTDYKLSDKLYFEPLCLEHVLNVIRKEEKSGTLLGVVTQLGGQTPLKLMKGLVDNGVTILGTDLAAVDICEDRGKFRELISELGLQQPQGLVCHTAEEVLAGAKKLGFPILIRPSYVLGGYRMQVINNTDELQCYLDKNLQDLRGLSLLLDCFLSGATELDVDAIADGQEVKVVGMVEHIEDAGIHSGDSCCVIPPHSLDQATIETVKAQTILLGQRLKVKGLLNVQYAIKDGVPYVLEVNPRASRTIPFIDKALGVKMIDLVMQVVLGIHLSKTNAPAKEWEDFSSIALRPDANQSIGESRAQTGLQELNSKGHYWTCPDNKLSGTELSCSIDPETRQIITKAREWVPDIPDFSQMKSVAIKRPVFSSLRFPGANTVLRPEMKSTGEVMTIDRSFAAALLKSYLATGSKLPKCPGSVLISVKDEDKAAAVEVAKKFVNLGFSILATVGTANYLKDNGVSAETVGHAGGKRPTVTDLLLDDKICYALNTTNNYNSLIDELSMRRILLTTNIPYAMTIKEAVAFVDALQEMGTEPDFTVSALQDTAT